MVKVGVGHESGIILFTNLQLMLRQTHSSSMCLACGSTVCTSLLQHVCDFQFNYCACGRGSSVFDSHARSHEVQKGCELPQDLRSV